MWFVGLIALVGTLLAAASKIAQPPWVCPLLVISAIFLIPLFIFLIFLMQTKFRTQSLDDQYYAEWLKRQEQIINQMESKLNESTKALVNSSASMKDMSQYGIKRIYSNQREALTVLVQDIESETVQLGFVGVSLRGILAEEESNSIRSLIEQKAKIPGFSLRFLFTHPSMASFRERPEGRVCGSIAKEIMESIVTLKSIGVPESSVRFYMAPPTASIIFTSQKMLFVPYSYSASPLDSVSFVVDNINDSPLYMQMRSRHFEVPWRSAIAIPLEEEIEQSHLIERVEVLLNDYLASLRKEKSDKADNNRMNSD